MSQNVDLEKLIKNNNFSNNDHDEVNHQGAIDISQDQEDQQMLVELDNPNNLHYDLSEPATHVNNKSFLERIFSSCMNNSRTRLSEDEMRRFNELKINANTPFIMDYDKHNEMIKKLWLIIHGEQLIEIRNDGWKKLGFQNSDPRTDFRAGGILSLKNLIYFCENYHDKINEMSDEKYEFLMAITSINITYFLIKYYHIADFLTKEDINNDIVCSRKALKTFVGLQLNDTNTFNKIYSMLLIDAFDTWIFCKKRWDNISIMEFKMVMDNLIKKFIKVTKSTIYLDVNSIKDKYQALPNKLVRMNKM